MKETLFRIAVGILINSLIYLSVAFIHWNLLWGMEIPQYAEIDRGMILFLSLIFNMLGQVAVSIGRD